jgi:sigma-B regulation protein RsbU (phosphoserine phosphatase)
MVSQETEAVHRFVCQELRGGNRLVSYSAELPGLSAWVFSQPLVPSARGGDLHYLSACSHGVIARVVLADVSGHGEVVGAAAGRLQEALRQHIDDWDQSSLIRQLNDTFLKGAARAQFATAFLGSFYSASGELLFTNAGHLPPLWYRTAAREWSFLCDSTPLGKEIVDLPLGLIAGTTYTQTAVQLDPDDLLLLYTDGINEAADESGEQLGLEGLLSMAQKLPVGSPIQAGEALLSAVSLFRGTAPATDDETVVALQRHAAPLSPVCDENE